MIFILLYYSCEREGKAKMNIFKRTAKKAKKENDKLSKKLKETMIREITNHINTNNQLIKEYKEKVASATLIEMIIEGLEEENTLYRKLLATAQKM